MKPHKDFQTAIDIFIFEAEHAIENLIANSIEIKEEEKESTHQRDKIDDINNLIETIQTAIKAVESI